MKNNFKIWIFYLKKVFRGCLKCEIFQFFLAKKKYYNFILTLENFKQSFYYEYTKIQPRLYLYSKLLKILLSVKTFKITPNL